MTAPRKELAEQDFINEGYSKNPFPLWAWFVVLIIFLGALWAGSNWYNGKLNLMVRSSPFLQVTNRQLSLFLWQNPEYMRINAKEKGSYLPAFHYLDKVTVDIAQADHFAMAPPELLFRYHVWDRLVRVEFSPRPIPKKDFMDFLSYAEEWHPRYWPDAPAGYIKLVENLASNPADNLATLPVAVLPTDVRIAFEGWTNYFKDAEAINEIQPTYSQMRAFLEGHPHYARNFWRNIVATVAPAYLSSVTSAQAKGDSLVPVDDMTSFLKVAVYNYLKTQPVSAPASEAVKSSIGKD